VTRKFVRVSELTSSARLAGTRRGQSITPTQKQTV